MQKPMYYVSLLDVAQLFEDLPYPELFCMLVKRELPHVVFSVGEVSLRYLLYEDLLTIVKTIQAKGYRLRTSVQVARGRRDKMFLPTPIRYSCAVA